MDGLAKKITTWFQFDIVLKLISIVALVCELFSGIISQFIYRIVYVDGDLVKSLIFNGNVCSILLSLVCCVSAILFVLYAFAWRRKMKTSTFCMFYFICGLAAKSLVLINAIIIHSQNDTPLYIYQGFVGNISGIAFSAMILFGLLPEKSFGNSVSSVPNVSSLNADKALELLNDKLDLGIITEEEYQVQRAEIISKL